MVVRSTSALPGTHNGPMSAVRLRVRTPALHLVAGPLVGCGVVATVAYAAIAVLGGLPTLLLPGLLPLAWLVAGAIALRARPGHSGAMLLALLGVLHLAAVLLDAVTHERFPLVLSGTASSVAAPEGLPMSRCRGPWERWPPCWPWSAPGCWSHVAAGPRETWGRG